MAKLFLKYDQAVLKEFTLSQGIVTIGRLPDNVVPIDNLAVSGHHAKIYWDSNQYFIEDNNSLNGTYVNNVRVSHQALKDGDSILIGKHTLAFKDEAQGERPLRGIPAEPAAPPMPKLDTTMMLDTKKMKEMLAGMASHPPANAASTTVPTPPTPTTAPPASRSDPPPGTHAKTQLFEIPS
jgi:pSer/pThr/pTyr-binding forkhead associated (FHA) protein